MLAGQRGSRLIRRATVKILDMDRSQGQVTDEEARKLAIAAYHKDLVAQGAEKNSLPIGLRSAELAMFDDQVCEKMKLDCNDYPGW